MVMLSQFNKEGKKTAFKNLTRADGRGAGQKTEFANVVVMLHKEVLESGLWDKATNDWIIEPGGYDRTMNVAVDKNTLGKTGRFQQYTNNCFNMFDPEV